MELVGSFATIIGLICNFKSENRATSDDEYKEFIEWLDTKRHKSIIDELHSNNLLGLSLKKLFSQNTDLVLQKLSALDRSIVDIASQIDGFKDIVSAVTKNEGLSNQAISILKQFDNSGGSVFLEIAYMGCTDYQVMDGRGGNNYINIEEERFIKDDLAKLCELGLLIPDVNKSGGRLFRITRAATYLVKQIDGDL